MTDIVGFWWMIAFFVIFHIFVIVGIFSDKISVIVRRIFVFLFKMLGVAVYELGKALLTAAVIGHFFFRDKEHDDSFTYSLVWSIIFFGIGYYLNEKDKR